jgi:hypothetical protein
MVDALSPASATSFFGLGGEDRFRDAIERVTASAGTSDRWIDDLKPTLRRLVAYDCAVLVWRDAESQRYAPVLVDGDAEAALAYFTSEVADAELRELGLYRLGWPMVAHRMAARLAETVAWRDYLLPAGFRDGLGVGLFADDGRYVGLLCLLTYRSHVVPATAAALLHGVNALLGSALDRSRERAGAGRPKADPASLT